MALYAANAMAIYLAVGVDVCKRNVMKMRKSETLHYTACTAKLSLYTKGIIYNSLQILSRNTGHIPECNIVAQ